VKLVEHNRVKLISVPGHRRLEGNEITDQLAKLGTECTFMGTEPAYGISAGVAKKTVRNWTNKDHKKYWESSIAFKCAKCVPQLSAKKNWGTTGTK
jgi:hypothetical protein